MSRLKRCLLGICCMLPMLVWAEECKQPDVLRFVTVPKQPLALQYREFEPMRQHLEQRLGIPVETVAAHSYQAVIEGIVSGAVDLAEMGPASYIRARLRDPGIQAVASYRFVGGTYSPEGSYYNSILLVPAGSRLRQPEDLEGRAIALTDPDSTSGAVIPLTRFVAETGIALQEVASPLVYAGSHDQALKLLQGGQVDAAFVASREADDYIERGEAAAEEWREIWRSPPIHYDPLVLSSRLCPEVAETLRDALLTPSPARNLLLQYKQALDILAVSHADYRWLEPLIQP